MSSLQFSRPESLDDALGILSRKPDATFVAGGQWLVPKLKSGEIQSKQIVSLDQISELRGISFEAGRVHIGASETHRTISTSPIVQEHAPILAEIAAQIGDPATRNRGTIGGALGSEPRRSDYSGPLSALDASLVTTTRTRAASELFTTERSARFQPGEILINISIALPTWGRFEKIPHTAANYADVAVFICQTADGAWRVMAMLHDHAPQRIVNIEDQLLAGTQQDALDWSNALATLSPFDASRIRTLFNRAHEGRTGLI